MHRMFGIDELIATGYNIIIRPHPQTFVSEKEMIENLMKDYPETDKLGIKLTGDNMKDIKSLMEMEEK